MHKKDINLGFVPVPFKEGTHMCLIYKDDEEREKIISQYLTSGLTNNEKVSYFAYRINKEELVRMLQKFCEIKNEQNLEVLNAQQTYCPHNYFEPEEMLETLRQFYKKSLKDGFACCRVSGEMHWALEPIKGTERLMEYEAKVNEVLVTHPVTAICQYDARKFSAEIIIECLKVHPYMIINGQVVENPYYMTPEEYLNHKNK